MVNNVYTVGEIESPYGRIEWVLGGNIDAKLRNANVVSDGDRLTFLEAAMEMDAEGLFAAKTEHGGHVVYCYAREGNTEAIAKYLQLVNVRPQ
tara:strand:- start:1491 stop:1769 length:279 start_codon:yes stop_codon:yes gene_type:complete